MKPSMLPVVGNLAVLAAGLAVLFGLPALGETYLVINSTIFAAFAILALSLALVWGYAGILCFGQAAFFGLGGYTYAVAAINMGDTTIPAVLAVLLPALFAALLGYFMFWGRISDVYLGVITLTVSLIFFRFINQTAGEQWNIGDAPLGGFNGIPATPILNWPGRPDEQLAPEDIFSLTVGLLLIAYFCCKALLATSFGRVIVAIRENETRAELLGYDTRVYKLAVFVIGGGLAGLSGLLFANSVFVSPTMFSLPVSGQIIIWVIIGGLGTLIGPVIGCILMQFLTNYLGTLSQVKGFGWVDPNLVLGVLLRIQRLQPLADAGDAPPVHFRPWMNVAVSLGWIGNAVAFLGLVAGYVALSAFVGMQVIWAVMVAATAWLAMRFVDDLVCTVLASRGAAGRRINTRFGIEPRLVDRAAVLLSVALRAVVALAALIALAMPWGAGGTDLVDRSMQLLRGITIGELVLSPRNIVRALLVFAGASLLLHLFRRWLERRLLPTTRMDEGMRASVATLVGYAGMVLAIAMALAAIGVGLERIAWIASALSVGIGFGLQAIVQNFISGLILLAERPVKVGDWVVVGDAEGDIRRINVRATEIQTGDRTTVLVPNSELITKAVRNRTYANAEGLVKIQLPMPLSTDPDRVRDLLLEVFREHPAILETPAPSVAIDNITNDRIVFSASGYVPSPRQASATRSALLFEILRRLRAQEMPPG